MMNHKIDSVAEGFRVTASGVMSGRMAAALTEPRNMRRMIPDYCDAFQMERIADDAYQLTVVNPRNVFAPKRRPLIRNTQPRPLQ